MCGDGGKCISGTRWTWELRIMDRMSHVQGGRKHHTMPHARAMQIHRPPPSSVCPADKMPPTRNTHGTRACHHRDRLIPTFQITFPPES